MRLHTWLVTAVALFATFGIALAALASSELSTQDSNAPAAQASSTPSTQPDLRALDGEWIFFDDKTEGRTLEQLGPPMASKFWMKVEEGAVVLNGHGSGHKDVRVAIDGKVTEVLESNGRVVRYRGSWKDSTFEYKVEFDSGSISWIKRSFRMTPDGLLVRVSSDLSAESEAVGLYRHAEDIPMPTPAKAAISDIAWLAGAWVGTRVETGSSNEERWSPPLGGAMLAVSRSVNKAGKMFAFEYLRIVEREGGLVYIAQPGGAKGTEFVLTELTTTRAVFENPRHDYPKRIVYELSPEGGLSATIGQHKGGTPRRYEWKREAK